jgi:hypothetical protein
MSLIEGDCVALCEGGLAIQFAQKLKIKNNIWNSAYITAQ